MQKLIGYLLLVSFLTSGTEFDQFMRIPVIFSHYHEHQSEDPALSFSDFFRIHFLDKSPMHQHKDMDAHNFPFKNHDINHHADFLKIYERRKQQAVIRFSHLSLMFSIPSADQLPPPACFADIWNPPKI